MQILVHDRNVAVWKAGSRSILLWLLVLFVRGYFLFFVSIGFFVSEGLGWGGTRRDPLGLTLPFCVQKKGHFIAISEVCCLFLLVSWICFVNFTSLLLSWFSHSFVFVFLFSLCFVFCFLFFFFLSLSLFLALFLCCARLCSLMDLSLSIYIYIYIYIWFLSSLSPFSFVLLSISPLFSSCLWGVLNVFCVLWNVCFAFSYMCIFARWYG